jgi:hypothetical protein
MRAFLPFLRSVDLLCQSHDKPTRGHHCRIFARDVLGPVMSSALSCGAV